MKRANHLIEQIADPDNLRLAFWKAKKGKNHSKQVTAYRDQLDKNLVLLRQQLLKGKVEVGDYYYFKIYDPKERQICAAAFREQVLHHAIMNVCHDYFEKKQIHDSYASRPNRGLHAALRTAKKNTQPSKWFLKLDIRKFFASIHHNVLKLQLEQLFKDDHLLAVFDQLIDSYEPTPKRGLPIGNLTSQYFANHYLSGLDHFIKEEIRCKAYVRYMDDMVLWHSDKDYLKNAEKRIQNYVEETLKCTLKPSLLNKSERGLPFCGYKLQPGYTRLSQRSKKRFIKKQEMIEEKYHSGEWDETYCQRKVIPLIAFTKYADAKVFRQQLS